MRQYLTAVGPPRHDGRRASKTLNSSATRDDEISYCVHFWYVVGGQPTAKASLVRRHSQPTGRLPPQDEKGTTGAIRRRACIDNRGAARGHGTTAGPARSSNQNRVRIPVVSSSWLFEPNVDAT
ncbi:hypothetical protein, partial [Burkholderia multivorans]|uniref:hypothetical protein n=1 Tax=Burkholderia multivorans TaxID=87883 RepID=UPI0021BE1C82